jgi:CubicO group peptidase (beta-lactamase class C family)
MKSPMFTIPKWRWFTTALSLGLVLSASGAISRAQEAPKRDLGRARTALAADGKYIDQLIAEFMTKNGVPGLSMAIVQAPYIPRSAGYGSASIVVDQLASTRTMWNVGPITQGFTAVAIFQLYEDGKLDIHAPVGKYLTDIPDSWRKITVFELLQHASGLRDYRSSTEFKENKSYSPQALLALVSRDPLQFASGTQVHMSATDFALLGLVIEKASGMSYRDFITTSQIEPLGLHSTMFAQDLARRSYLDRPQSQTKVNEHLLFKTKIPFIDPVEPATGYKEVADQLVPTDPMSSETLFAFGSLWSSAEDISIWDIGLAGSTLVHKAENRALIYSPTRLQNGTIVPAMAGWEFTHHPGFMEIKGDSPGFSSYLSRFTAQSELVCVTLLADKEGLDLTTLARDIAEAYQSGLGPQTHKSGLISQESKFGVDETVSHLQMQLKKMNVPLFATFDHSENAKKAGLDLRPTKVLVFGNPKVGTKLMLDNQAVAIDLPLRLSVWEDERGRVWTSYEDVDQTAREYGINDDATVDSVRSLVERLVASSVNVYDY